MNARRSNTSIESHPELAGTPAGSLSGISPHRSHVLRRNANASVRLVLATSTQAGSLIDDKLEAAIFAAP
jgi:hypothetical protein